MINQRNKRILLRDIYPFSFMVFLFILFPSPGFSNIPVPSLFGVGAPFYLSLKTIGLIFLAIIILEASVLRFGLKIAWKKSIISVLIANLVSSFLGVLISGNLPTEPVIWPNKAMTSGLIKRRRYALFRSQINKFHRRPLLPLCRRINDCDLI